MACTHSSKCELYVQFAADPSIQLWKQHYCMSNYKRCARYSLSLQGVSVPLSLLPNGKTISLDMSEDDRGLHALFNAIQKNRLSMVKAFVKTKTTTSKVANSEGITPVMYAAGLGHQEIMQYFLEHGCNPHHRNKKGETALDVALAAGHTGCASILKSYMRQVPPPDVSETVLGESVNAEKSRSLMGRVMGFLRGSKPETV